MSESKHTSLPWRLGAPDWHRGTYGRDCKQPVYADGRRGVVAEVFGAQVAVDAQHLKQDQVDSPDGVFIVRACNNHYELLAVLGCVMEGLRFAIEACPCSVKERLSGHLTSCWVGRMPPCSEDPSDLLTRGATAIAKAEGREP